MESPETGLTIPFSGAASYRCHTSRAINPGGAIVYETSILDSVRNIENAHVVRDEQNGGALFGCKFLKFPNDRIPGRAVQRSGRFIGKDDFGSRDQGACNGNALPFSPPES